MKIIDHSQVPQVTLQSGNLRISFLETGDIYRFGTKQTIINQVLSNPIDGSLNNLYLRLFHEDGSISYQPMLGIQSESRFMMGDSQVRWVGEYEGIQYTVTFILASNQVWFWKVDLEGNKKKVDVVYGQDLGVADIGTVQSNEAYTSQYVDHQVFDHPHRGYAVTSRQNMPQHEGTFPYVQLGSFHKVASYVTDGFHFFGREFKETNQPFALSQESLSSEIYQYEFNYTALQIQPFELEGKKEIVFYGIFLENHKDAVASLEYEDLLLTARKDMTLEEVFTEAPLLKKNPEIGQPLETLAISNEEMIRMYPSRLQEEAENDNWLSFFTEEYNHVVSKEKEMQLERSHGHILFTGGHWKQDESIMTTTNWMFGVFNAQTLAGNTDMNKWLTNTRNPLNILKTSGQRIYVKIAGQYRLLTMPSVYEMGINYSKWLYRTEEETFIVQVFASYGTSEITLQLHAESAKQYEFLVTNQVVLNQKEYEAPIHMETKDRMLRFKSDESTLNHKKYPNLEYVLQVEGTDMTLKDESMFVNGAQPGSASLAVLELAITNQFKLRMFALIEGEEPALEQKTIEQENRQFQAYFNKLTNGFKLQNEKGLPDELEKLNVMAWWYTHNMLVHFLVPHGLEQYGGAAWGTRDVSQGPVEYFLATQHFDVVKEIIKTLFSHQFEEDGNWPQWFMFDRYFDSYSDESHGDIIVWPLKLVADYLLATGDYDILDHQIPYMSKTDKTFTATTASLKEHLIKEIDYIKSHFLWDTYLSSYGDGDWDDTLQPNDQSLKVNMASSWTVALTYQALTTFYSAIAEKDKQFSQELKELSEHIRADYNRYILSGDVIPGFVYMPEADKIEFMIHPTDTKTGIKYRLLPMIQGIISGIFTKNQAKNHYHLIKENLQFPDGVRLMNQPATYNGGVSTNFKRAEQAANFGREVGLQYVHAHIRFIESMAKLGKADEVWQGLEVINPINIDKIVPNAEKRQSNAYFSSSDGNFKNRYDAKENFNKLKTGEVTVKGGWRIYSSGPGIYLNQLISHALGISVVEKDLLIDPILPIKYDGLLFQFAYAGKAVMFKLSYSKKNPTAIIVNGKEITGEKNHNPYREGGVRYSKDKILPLLNNDENEIEVFYQLYE